ncbi:MAG: hypothetical protein WA708_09175 [Acidobacteriaceae bacterium]
MKQTLAGSRVYTYHYSETGSGLDTVRVTTPEGKIYDVYISRGLNAGIREGDPGSEP